MIEIYKNFKFEFDTLCSNNENNKTEPPEIPVPPVQSVQEPTPPPKQQNPAPQTPPNTPQVVPKKSSPQSVPLPPQLQHKNATSAALSLMNVNYDLDIVNTKLKESCIKLRYALNAEAIICSIQFDETGTYFAFADGRTLFVINSLDGSLTSTFEIPRTSGQGEMYTRAIAFSPDSQFISITGSTRIVYLFSMLENKLEAVFEAHVSNVSALLFSKDSKVLYSGGFDGNIHVWDIETKKILKTVTHGNPDDNQNPEKMIVGIEYTPDETHLLVAFMNGTIMVYDLEFSQSSTKFKAHNDYLIQLAVSPELNCLATASNDKTAKIWSFNYLASLKHTLSGHEDFVISVKFSPHSHYLITGSKDERLKCWDCNDGSLQFSIRAHKNTIFDISHHPTDPTFVSCSGDGMICVWDYQMP